MLEKMWRKNKKAQVWVETVIYILIGLSLIAVVLAFALPKIEEQKDKITIERTLEAMSQLENNIREIKLGGPSDQRENYITLSKGQLAIDSPNNAIIFEMKDSNYPLGNPGEYSEISNNIPGTGLKATTKKAGKKYDITIILEYTNINLSYDNGKTKKIITQSPTVYVLMVQNNGKPNSPIDNSTNINFYLK